MRYRPSSARRRLALAGAVIVLCANGIFAGQTLDVVDSLGRHVAVPRGVRRVISLEPEISRIIVALGAGERLVGIDFFLRHYDHLFPLIFPAAGRLPVVSNAGQELNFEAALGLRPDIVFASPSEAGMAESIERKLRAPVVSLASLGRMEALLAEIDTLGRLLGREDRARRLTALAEETLAPLKRRAEALTRNERPSVYLAFWGSLERTPISYEPVDLAGGRNVAAGLLPDYLGAAGVTVSVEKILAWDPEVILLQGSYLPAERRLTVDGVLRDPRLASVRAVRTGRVYYTFGYWYWWDPALVLVESLYLKRLLSAGDGTPGDLQADGDRLFNEFYGVGGAFTALCRLLECHDWATR